MDKKRHKLYDVLWDLGESVWEARLRLAGVAFLVFVAGIAAAELGAPPITRLIALILMFIALAPYYLLVLGLLLMAMAFWVLVGIVIPALRVAAWGLDRQEPGHPVRWVALIMVVAGFHFDLLAS